MPNQQKKHRGFAAMDQEKQREIASKGGKAAHEKGTAHEFTPEEAREAGRKGGETVSQNREHMAAIGRKGGESSHGSRATSSQNGDDTRKGKNGHATEQAEAKR
jgi:general stress protein YciG